MPLQLFRITVSTNHVSCEHDSRSENICSYAAAVYVRIASYLYKAKGKRGGFLCVVLATYVMHERISLTEK